MGTFRRPCLRRIPGEAASFEIGEVRRGDIPGPVEGVEAEQVGQP